MRLISRWLWTLIALSGCVAIVMLLAVHSNSKSEGLLNSEQRTLRLSPLPSLLQQQKLPKPMATTLKSISVQPAQQQLTAQAGDVTQLSRPANRQDNDNAKPTAPSKSASISFRQSCWKSGFSPASGRPINHTPGDFIISESRLCSGRPLLLALVHSEFGCRVRRDLARSTWASINNINGHRIVVAFVVGATRTAEQQAALQEESKETGDLLQVPCNPDGHPSASTCKTLYSLKWANQYCPGAKFLLKVDDYAFVNVFQLVTLATGRLAGANNTFYCRTAANEDRITQSSYYWHVSEAEWPHAKYPLHCKGLAYLMSGDLPSRLLKCAAWRNFLRLEDIFVTGVLGEALGANLMHWFSGWDSAWLHPRHAGPAVGSAVVFISQEGAPLLSLHQRVWRAALRYCAAFAGLT